MCNEMFASLQWIQIIVILNYQSYQSYHSELITNTEAFLILPSPGKSAPCNSGSGVSEPVMNPVDCWIKYRIQLLPDAKNID